MRSPRSLTFLGLLSVARASFLLRTVDVFAAADLIRFPCFRFRTALWTPRMHWGSRRLSR